MKEWAYRALRTFAQAAGGFIATNLVLYLTGVDYSDTNALKTAGIGLATAALSAGIAAVMNIRAKEPPDLIQ